MQKQSVWILWVGVIAMWALGGGWVATAGRWIFGLIFVAHAVEFIVHRSLFERVEGSMGHHFVQTMIYGLYHWKPLKERLDAEPV